KLQPLAGGKLALLVLGFDAGLAAAELRRSLLLLQQGFLIRHRGANVADERACGASWPPIARCGIHWHQFPLQAVAASALPPAITSSNRPPTCSAASSSTSANIPSC